MAEAIPYAMAAMSVMSSVNSNNAQKAAAQRQEDAAMQNQHLAMEQARLNSEAAAANSKQLYDKATASEAVAQHKAEEVARQGRLALSKYLAVSASQGGSGTPQLMQGILEQFQKGKNAELYQGEEAAKGQRYSADVNTWEVGNKNTQMLRSADQNVQQTRATTKATGNNSLMSMASAGLQGYTAGGGGFGGLMPSAPPGVGSGMPSIAGAGYSGGYGGGDPWRIL